MAFLYSRLLTRTLRTQLPIAQRAYATHSELPDPEDLATGLEKYEMMENSAGNQDPFKMMAIQRKPSSKSNPNLVHSYYDCRMVGCVCEEDSSNIVWMWLFKGEPKRCECGHWFQLKKFE